MNKFTVISGFYDKGNRGLEWFQKAWEDNHRKYLGLPQSAHSIVISVGGCDVYRDYGADIWLDGNTGCGLDLDSGRKTGAYSGSTGIWMAGMWLAYLNETDYLQVEQDCLAFGPWIKQLYADLGDKQAIFGRTTRRGGEEVGFGIHLIRRDYIPTFCAFYLLESDGRERSPENYPERIVWRMMQKKPNEFALLSFGVDRDRPIPYDDEVFYAQKLTPAEMRELAKRGLVDIAGMPEVSVFSNNHEGKP